MSDNPHPHDPEGNGYHGTKQTERVSGEHLRVAIAAGKLKRGENPSQVTHPSNAAPGHPALTNVGTIHDR